MQGLRYPPVNLPAARGRLGNQTYLRGSGYPATAPGNENATEVARETARVIAEGIMGVLDDE